ncbi:hypothetical protein M758_UG029500 [Ceratodon purpureus]|nr:hypothetical protein M758_UG029500 [Ceratodon purpureus]
MLAPSMAYAALHKTKDTRIKGRASSEVGGFSDSTYPLFFNKTEPTVRASALTIPLSISFLRPATGSGKSMAERTVFRMIYESHAVHRCTLCM